MTLSGLFRVFLWKHFLFLRFNWLPLFIILIGCFGILTVYLKSTYQLLTTNNVIYETKDVAVLKVLFPSNDDDYIFFTPNDPFTRSLMKRVRISLQLSEQALKVFGTTADMVLALENNCNGNCFGIEFQNFPHIQNSFLSKTTKKAFQYAISSTSIQLSPEKRYVNDEEVNGIKDDDDYIRTGFLILQNLIDQHFIQMQSKEDNAFELKISSLPSIAIETMDSESVCRFGQIFAIIANVLLLSTFIVPLVEEKQNGLKESLALATPYHFLNAVTFFLVRFCVYIVFLSAAFLVAFNYHSLGITPIPFIFILFVLYMTSTMFYAYLVSVCFNSVFYAKIGGFLLLGMPFLLQLIKGKLSTMVTYLFNTKCFLDGLDTFQIFTNKHRQLVFGDIFVNITDSSFKIVSIYVVLVCQCILYSLIYIYLSSIFPGRGGQKRSYLFFMNKNFRVKRQRNQYTSNGKGSSDVAIIIQDLVKKFYTGSREIKIANRLNMEIKNNRITVLLGHNGAGKTTILNIIMGCIPKDSGKILVCSERNVSTYRHLIGYCPQHSIFMHYMTCKQHLVFFAQLRGMSNREASILAEQLLELLKLSGKKHEYGRNLSGGMKRRLSLGIAISGDTRIVILDEPSSGLDIQSRRELWDVLLELRKSKAVLVTTHHMEEAEVLGDTICILANGRLERTGSPLELKRKIGSGYILKLRTNELFNENATISFIQETSPSAVVMNIVPPTVLVNLPYADRSIYSDILQRLEESQSTLGISSIAISDTSLEDVFLNCAAAMEQIDSPASFIENSSIPYEPLKLGSITFSQQFLAVCYKKFIYLRNDIFHTSIVLSLPFLSAGLAILLMFSMSIVEHESAVELNLQQIKDGVIYIRQIDNLNNFSKYIAANLKDIIQNNGIQVKELTLLEDSLAKELIQIQQRDLAFFLQNVIGAIEYFVSENGKVEFNIYFSGNIYHSSVILVNLIDSIILKMKTNKENEIITIYVPIKRILNDVSPARLEYYAVIFPIGLFLYMSFYVSLPFNEYKSGFKNLQPIPRFTYWLSIGIFDFALHLLICVILGIFQGFVMPLGLYSTSEVVVIMMSVVFYGLSYLPILYCLANAFRSLSTLSTYLLFMLTISAITPLITSGNVHAMKKHELAISLLSILPDFNLNHQLRIINENFIIHRRNSHVDPGQFQERLYAWSFFLTAITVFLVVTAFFFYCWENKKKRQDLQNVFNCHSCSSSTKSRNDMPTNYDEMDLVHQQKSDVENIFKENRESQYPLMVHELLKLYGHKIAVNGLSFTVKKKECFGLLGVNGAGKTTSFQMLTANITMSAGTIKIFGLDILKNENQYKYLFGYCPEKDCFNILMTSYQILKYMAQLRGIKGSAIHLEVMYWLIQLDLLKYRNVLIKYYSGGTKRKLNAAIAMIGSPPVIFLDEPTTGVDPVSRRFLWKCIQNFQKRDKTVVLTSHSMDECEQLCNRLAIMVDGQLKCLGCVPDLKQHYGTGFTISIKMKALDTSENVNEITTQITIHFPHIALRENHAGMLTFFVETSSKIAWSKIFNKMEQLFFNCGDLIEDYSVNESKLEDIFLTFEKKIREHSGNSHEV